MLTIIASLVIVPMLGCGPLTGEDTHPNAPQAPGPSRGGPPVPQPTQPSPAPADPNANDHKPITIRAGGFKKEYVPYTVDIYAVGGDPANIHDPVASGDYERTIHYDAARGVTVHVVVKPSRVGSTAGYCAIEAGNHHDGPRFISGASQLDCYLTIKPAK